jgi:hypothetical protein
MREYYRKKGSAPFVEKAREEMRYLGRLGVFESWTEEPGAKDDPLAGVAVLKIPRAWAEWRRQWHDDHLRMSALRLASGEATPKADEADKS